MNIIFQLLLVAGGCYLVWVTIAALLNRWQKTIYLVCWRTESGTIPSDIDEGITELQQFGPSWIKESRLRGTDWRAVISNYATGPNTRAVRYIMIAIRVPKFGWIRPYPGFPLREDCQPQLERVKTQLGKANLTVGETTREELERAPYMPRRFDFYFTAKNRRKVEWPAIAASLRESVHKGGTLSFTVHNRMAYWVVACEREHVTDVGGELLKAFENLDDHRNNQEAPLWISPWDVMHLPRVEDCAALPTNLFDKLIRLETPRPIEPLEVGRLKGETGRRICFNLKHHLLVVRAPQETEVEFAANVQIELARRCAAAGEVVVYLYTEGDPLLKGPDVVYHTLDNEWPPQAQAKLLAELIAKAEPGTTMVINSLYQGEQAQNSFEMLIRAISNERLQNRVRIFLNRFVPEVTRQAPWGVSGTGTANMVSSLVRQSPRDSNMLVELKALINKPNPKLRLCLVLEQSDFIGVNPYEKLWGEIAKGFSSQLWLRWSMTMTESKDIWSFIAGDMSATKCAVAVCGKVVVRIFLDQEFYTIPDDLFQPAFAMPRAPESELSIILGLGTLNARKLNEAGITTFEELAALDETELILKLNDTTIDTGTILGQAAYGAQYGVEALAAEIRQIASRRTQGPATPMAPVVPVDQAQSAQAAKQFMQPAAQPDATTTDDPSTAAVDPQQAIKAAWQKQQDDIVNAANAAAAIVDQDVDAAALSSWLN